MSADPVRRRLIGVVLVAMLAGGAVVAGTEYRVRVDRETARAEAAAARLRKLDAEIDAERQASESAGSVVPPVNRIRTDGGEQMRSALVEKVAGSARAAGLRVLQYRPTAGGEAIVSLEAEGPGRSSFDFLRRMEAERELSVESLVLSSRGAGIARVEIAVAAHSGQAETGAVGAVTAEAGQVDAAQVDAAQADSAQADSAQADATRGRASVPEAGAEVDAPGGLFGWALDPNPPVRAEPRPEPAESGEPEEPPERKEEEKREPAEEPAEPDPPDLWELAEQGAGVRFVGRAKTADGRSLLYFAGPCGTLLAASSTGNPAETRPRAEAWRIVDEDGAQLLLEDSGGRFLVVEGGGAQ